MNFQVGKRPLDTSQEKVFQLLFWMMLQFTPCIWAHSQFFLYVAGLYVLMFILSIYIVALFKASFQGLVFETGTFPDFSFFLKNNNKKTHLVEGVSFFYMGMFSFVCFMSYESFSKIICLHREIFSYVNELANLYYLILWCHICRFTGLIY